MVERALEQPMARLWTRSDEERSCKETSTTQRRRCRVFALSTLPSLDRQVCPAHQSQTTGSSLGKACGREEINSRKNVSEVSRIQAEPKEGDCLIFSPTASQDVDVPLGSSGPPLPDPCVPGVMKNVEASIPRVCVWLRWCALWCSCWSLHGPGARPS